jgi:hypothetical protein
MRCHGVKARDSRPQSRRRPDERWDPRGKREAVSAACRSSRIKRTGLAQADRSEATASNSDRRSSAPRDVPQCRSRESSATARLVASTVWGSTSRARPPDHLRRWPVRRRAADIPTPSPCGCETSIPGAFATSWASLVLPIPGSSATRMVLARPSLLREADSWRRSSRVAPNEPGRPKHAAMVLFSWPSSRGISAVHAVSDASGSSRRRTC